MNEPKHQLGLMCLAAAVLLDLCVLLGVYQGRDFSEIAFVGVFAVLALLGAVYVWLMPD